MLHFIKYKNSLFYPKSISVQNIGKPNYREYCQPSHCNCKAHKSCSPACEMLAIAYNTPFSNISCYARIKHCAWLSIYQNMLVSADCVGSTPAVVTRRIGSPPQGENLCDTIHIRCSSDGLIFESAADQEIDYRACKMGVYSCAVSRSTEVVIPISLTSRMGGTQVVISLDSKSGACYKTFTCPKKDKCSVIPCTWCLK